MPSTPKTNFISVDCDGEINSAGDLKEMLDLLRADAESYSDGDLNEFIRSCQVKVYEVKAVLEVKEEVKRTVYINGEIASL